MPRESRRSRSPPRHKRLNRSRSPSKRNSSRSRNTRDRSPPYSMQKSREREQRRSARSDYRHRRRQRSRSPSLVRRDSRSRSPSQRKNRARSGSPSPARSLSRDDNKEQEISEEALQKMTEEEQMNALLGFGGFGSTKGKQIAGNDVGTANVKKQRKFRQYMNRKGGFNRLLDKV